VQHSVEKHMECDVAKIIRDTLDTFDTLDAAAKVKETTTPEHEEALVPCVDGSELARAFFTFAALVGAAMCSAFECGTQGRWP
jgi:hypothetical protein